MMPLSKGMYYFVDNIVEVTADMMNAAFQSVDILEYYGLPDGENEYIPIDRRGHGAIAWCCRTCYAGIFMLRLYDRVGLIEHPSLKHSVLSSHELLQRFGQFRRMVTIHIGLRRTLHSKVCLTRAAETEDLLFCASETLRSTEVKSLTRDKTQCIFYFSASIPLGNILTNSLAQDHFDRLTKRCTVSSAYVAAIYATKIFESSLASLQSNRETHGQTSYTTTPTNFPIVQCDRLPDSITFRRYQDEGTMERNALEESRTQRPEPSKPNMGIRDCRDHQHVPKGSWLRPGKKTHSLKSSLSGSGSRAEKYYEVRLFESNKDCFIIHNNESTTAGLVVDVSGSTSWRQLDESRESGNVTLKLSVLTIEFSLRASVCIQCHVAGMNEQDSVRSGE
ncbi:uncharacterized protein BO96DRAFT_490378 [Aspergillus niger CBS 101883]|uniref:uncharacterized protein n=1 Tax=Aspergillus lacticoffeatus (strain CBS 101883) TaxID=1450533 RepID=UPI000D802E80|nr:uncharacterized protein BO96DRAFT_490378 [Aspergillus niger CBS 101883]PYH50640.1 hypothetical protein BO96DRAFT_490378 [Aspergillus niger CBS 101883]